MKKQVVFWLCLMMIPAFSGCKFLVAQDLSGTVALYPSEEGFAFKTVSEVDYSKSYGYQQENFLRKASLDDFREYLEQSGRFEINAVRYDLTIDPWKPVYKTELYERQGRKIPTNLEANHEYGASWNETINCDELKWKTKSISRKGEATVSFEEKTTKQVCLVNSSYEITYNLIRKNAEDALEPDEMEIVQGSISAKGSVKIGFRHCLLGERVVDKNLKFKVCVLDSNFDGKFDETDLVKIEQVERLIPFNDSVSVVDQSNSFLAGKARNYRYIINLIAPPVEGEPYTLNVKRIQ